MWRHGLWWCIHISVRYDHYLVEKCFFVIATLWVCVSALRKTHHIKDDQNTMGKHIRKAEKCDRAVSLSPSLSHYVCVCVCVCIYSMHLSSSLHSIFHCLFLLFSPCFSSSFSSTHAYITYHWYHDILYQLKQRLHLLCMSDRQHIFSRGRYL